MYETRDWSTSYRGPLLIHAAKKIVTKLPEELCTILFDEFGAHWRRDLPRGALIATCTLVNCIPTERMQVDDKERACGNFAPERFAWDVQNSRVFAAPIPYRGMQGLFDVPEDVLATPMKGRGRG